MKATKRSIFNVCTAEVEQVVTAVTGHYRFPGIRPPALVVYWDREHHRVEDDGSEAWF